VKDKGIIALLQRIDRLQAQIASLVYEIEHSDHPRAAEIVQAIKDEGWVIVSTELVGVEVLGETLPDELEPERDFVAEAMARSEHRPSEDLPWEH
jgi:hypothetical protein